MSWADTQRLFAAAMLRDDTQVHALIRRDAIDAHARLAIYRHTIEGTLCDALGETFRSVQRLVGDDYFAALSLPFIRTHPPQSGDINRYGAGFAEYIAQHEVSAQLAYLADMAAFEWQWSRCFYSAEQTQSFAVTCRYPAYAIWRWCIKDGGAGEPPAIDAGHYEYLLQREGAYVTVRLT